MAGRFLCGRSEFGDETKLVGACAVRSVIVTGGAESGLKIHTKTTGGDNDNDSRNTNAAPYRVSARADFKSPRTIAAKTPIAAPTQITCNIVQPAAVHTGEVVNKFELMDWSPSF
jgi:hypothetical protein